MALVYQNGCFLMVRRAPALKAAPGYWCPVSGKLEPDETAAEAAVRELQEEVGVTGRALEKVTDTVTDCGTYELEWWHVEVTGEPKVNCDEITEVRWVTPEELALLEPSFEQDLQVFREWLQKTQGICMADSCGDHDHGHGHGHGH